MTLTDSSCLRASLHGEFGAAMMELALGAVMEVLV